MKTRISPEYGLLLSCAGTDPSKHHLLIAGGLLQKPLDWHRVLELASWHRLSALLFNTLRRRELADGVPHWAMQRLESIYFDNAARNIYFQAELHKVLQLLAAEGIATIVLKGAALAETVYRDIALRPMTDLDILVQEQHLNRADDLIRSLGFAPAAHQADPEIQKKIREGHRHYPTLVSPEGIVPLEIHRHIVEPGNPLHFDLAGFWARAQHMTIAGTQALGLAPEDLLIHLSINFFLDRKYRSSGALGQLCDISETIQQYAGAVDWDLFADEARRHNLAGPVCCALFAVKELLETSPSEIVLRSLEPDAFNPTMVGRFIERRVLRARAWVPLEFIRPNKRPFRRIFPESSSGRAGSLFCLYIGRLFKASRIVSSSLARPWELWQDLTINRWLGSLYKSRF